MAVSKNPYPHTDEQREIIIERREEVGRVPLGQGPGSAITEAFRISGEYISDHLGPGLDENITVEFDLDGHHFIAKVES